MTGPYVLRVIGMAGVEVNLDGGSSVGGFIGAYDVDAMGGVGWANIVPDPAHATRFATAGEAFNAWRSRGTVMPTRPDGQPNRPLTAYTCEVITLAEARRTIPRGVG